MIELPSSWAQAAIVEILDTNTNGKPFQQGWSPQCEAMSAPDDRWGVLKTTAIQSGEFRAHENKLLPGHLEPRPNIEVKPGDVLMTCAGPRSRCGVVCFVERTRPLLMLSGKMYRFRSHPTAMDPKYLAYAIQARDAQLAIDRMKTGISDSGLNLTHDRFAQLGINVAPLNEQRRIVAKIEELFSEIDKGVESLKTAQQQLKAYRQAVLKHAFEGKLTADWRASRSISFPTGQELLSRIREDALARHDREVRDWQIAANDADGADRPRPHKPRKPAEPDRPSPYQISQMRELPESWTWVQLGDLAFVTKLAGFEYTKFVNYDETGDLEILKAENAGPDGFRETSYSRIRSDTIEQLGRSRLTGRAIAFGAGV